MEALYLMGTTKSHRGSRDFEMLRFGSTEAHLRMKFEKQEVSHQIDMHLRKSKGKGIAVDSNVIRKSADVIGIANMVFFSPEDLNIVKNSPGERRRFMDMELCQLDKTYLYAFTSYRKVLQQRNSILKQAYYRKDLLDTLGIWDEKLVEYGKALILAREAFLEELKEEAASMHSHLSGGREVLEVAYQPSVTAEHFEERLKASRERDLAQCQTNIGPHKDDILLKVQKQELRRFGSQGQQRTAALSLKMAEIALVKRRIKDSPVLLLDDVLSELDRSRQAHLLENIRGIQTFVTCTGMEELVEQRMELDHVYHVVSGSVAIKNEFRV
jgi:DNA replication and repair protein RecF